MTREITYPKLFMLCGLPGTGKSTWVKKNQEFIQNYWGYTAVLSTDSYIEHVAKQENKTYSDVFKQYINQAENQMEAVLHQAIANRDNIIWDQTNLHPKVRMSKLSKVPKFYQTFAIWFYHIDEQIHNQWLNSPERYGKNIPSAVLKSMKAGEQQPTIKEGFSAVFSSKIDLATIIQGIK